MFQILWFLTLPSSFPMDEVPFWISSAKDVDGIHPLNLGKFASGISSLVPCTATGIIKLLSFYNIKIEGSTACVIGRSSIVGSPTSSLLLQSNATTINIHKKTENLGDLTRLADILVVATGHRGLITNRHVKKGAVIVDVGIHRGEDGKLVGDVVYDDEMMSKISAFTPVPGGVGPMTISMLLQNTILAAEKRQSESEKP